MSRRQDRAKDPLSDFSRYSGLNHCFSMIYRELGRRGSDGGDLPPHQWRMLSDLDDGLDEHVMSRLFDYWDYNLELLFARGRDWRKGVPAKPRIDLFVEVTTKDNLKVEWYPRGGDQWGQIEREHAPSDFRGWHRLENRSGGYDSRPSNELLFIHDVRWAVRGLSRGTSPEDRRMDQALLLTCARMIEEIKSRLEPHFDVRMLTDIFMTFERDEVSIFNTDTMTDWVIDSPERREREAELEELENVREWLGVSEKGLLELWDQCSKKKGSGPAPDPANNPPKVAKALRAAGHDVTAYTVKRAMELIGKYRPPSAQVFNLEDARKSREPTNGD